MRLIEDLWSLNSPYYTWKVGKERIDRGEEKIGVWLWLRGTKASQQIRRESFLGRAYTGTGPQKRKSREMNTQGKKNPPGRIQ